MADSSFGSKLLSFLNTLFQNISSPIPGFDVSDVQAKQEGDNFTSLFQFENSEANKITNKEGNELTDIKGNKIEVNVLLKTLNAQEVLNPLLTGINSLGDEGISNENKNALLDVLLGADRTDNGFHRNNGKGLLGYIFDGKSEFAYQSPKYANSTEWSWGGICKKLKFALECQSPGKDYGAIEGKNLEECGNLVGEYLTKVGITSASSEAQIKASSLVFPICMIMQDFLIEYYADALKKYGEPEFTPKPDDDQGNPDNADQGNPDDIDEFGAEEDMESQLDALGEDFNASKHIDVTLQKITGTTKVKMTAITANYGFGEVLDDIDEIINQDEFIEALPEAPTSYAIDVDDDGFDIEPCEECIECNPCDSLAEIFKAGIRAYRNLYIIHWMSFGNDMMKLHLLAEDMYEELIKEIDTVGELLVEKCGSVPQLDFPCDYVAVQNYDFQSGLAVIQSLINMYIDCIDYAYCNQDSDVQSTLDEWLRYWKKQMKYFVERQEM